MKEDPRIRHLSVGVLSVNCCLVQPEPGGVLFIIDPGGNPEAVLKEVRNMGPASGYRIMLTHGHFDHIGAVGAVAKALNIDKVWLSGADEALYRSPINAMLPYCAAVKDLIPSEEIPETDAFRTIRIPGHTLGSVCYYFRELNAVFTGDTLFCGGVGRTDLPGSGEYKDMIAGIREKLFTLPPETAVYPGHEDFSTIGEEVENNPYFS